MVEAIRAMPTLTHNIKAEEARGIVTGFILDYLGNQLLAGRPYLMVSAIRAVWVVPVELTYIHTDVIGIVGVVAVDEETGHIIAWTPIDEMKTAGKQLRASREPQVSEEFKSFKMPQEDKIPS